jgi:2-methylisocitrate lyase-like PEP mutase family enzyme
LPLLLLFCTKDMEGNTAELEEIHVERISRQPSFLLKASLDIPPVFHQIKQEEQIKINKKKAKESRRERKQKKKKEKQQKKDKKKKEDARNTIVNVFG